MEQPQELQQLLNQQSVLRPCSNGWQQKLSAYATVFSRIVRYLCFSVKGKSGIHD